MMPEGPSPSPRLTDSRFFAIALPLCVLAMMFLAWAVPLHFSTVDDVEMEGIASGALTGQPEFRLVFVHAFLGKILQFLYAALPAMPWYAGVFLVCHGFAMALMITLVRHANQAGGIAATAIGAGLHFYCLSDLQFTTTACLLGAWATVWLWKLATRPRFRWADGMWLWSFLGLMLAWLLRKEAVAFALIGLAPMFLLVFARGKGSWLPRLALPMVAGLLLLGTGYIDQALQFDTPEWQQFRTYNQRRGLLQDAYTFHYDAYKAEAAKAGWSQADFALFDEFLSDAAAPFQLASLEEIYAESAPRLNQKLNWEGIGVAFGDMLKYYRYLLLGAVLLLASAVLAGKRSWCLWAVPVITLVLLVVQGHYFGSKDRLIVSGLAQVTVAALAFFVVYGEDSIELYFPTRKGRAMLINFLALTGAGFAARANLVNARIRHDEIAQHLAVFSERVGSYADGKVLVNVDTYPALVNDPFHLLPRPRAAGTAHVVPLGWFAASPYQKQLAAKAGLNPDSSIVLQLVNAKGRFFLGTSAQAGLVKDFMQQHTRLPVDTASLGPFPYFRGNQLRVFKFRAVAK